MKKSEIKVLVNLDKEKSLGELARDLKISKSQISKTLTSLSKKKIIKIRKERKNKFYSLSEDPISILTYKILRKNPRILEGKKELLLNQLNTPKSLREIQIETGISLKQIIKYLQELQSYGIVEEINRKYRILPKEKDLLDLVKLSTIKKENIVWEKGGEYLEESNEMKNNATLTAFNLFSRYNLKIFPDKFYYYYPKKELTVEEIFIHSLKFSKTKQQILLSMLFYLKNKYKMSGARLKTLAKKFEAYNLLNQVFRFLTNKKSEGNFPSYEEFLEKATQYIKVEVSSTREEIINLFKKLDKTLKKKINLYLIGGGNMVIKNLKISTKDIDILVEKKDFLELKNKLIELGFDFSTNIFEKGNFRIDIFVDRVLGGYFLSKRMKKDAELYYSGKNIKIFLLSNEDIFLLKTYSGREGDLEDCKILAEKGINWNKILVESLEQEKKIGKFLSISLLDTLDDLNEIYKIKAPILKFLEKHCMRKLLKFALKEEKSVKELVNLLEKPEPTIRKILKEMEKNLEVEKVKYGKVFKFKERPQG